MTCPTPVQFNCVSCDASGEIVAAGTTDTFQVKTLITIYSQLYCCNATGIYRESGLTKYDNFELRTIYFALFISINVNFWLISVFISCHSFTYLIITNKQVCTWNMQTGRLLELLSGHEGPVSSLVFTEGMFVHCCLGFLEKHSLKLLDTPQNF